jgi:hypothetical protein
MRYSSFYSQFDGQNGGAGGCTKTVKDISVTPGQSIAVTVGAGGSKSYSYRGSCGSDGGSSSIGDYTASGGSSYYNLPSSQKYASGGSGGGGAGGSSQSWYYTTTPSNYIYSDYFKAGNGGSNGSDGGGSEIVLVSNGSSRYVGMMYEFTLPSKGQGTTTRYFGESNGTLYAGGGGGSGGDDSIGNICINAYIGYGGAGGGGNGAYCEVSSSNGVEYTIHAATSGSANTGGGGGGTYLSFSSGYYSYAPGGSGIAIIRWGKK